MRLRTKRPLPGAVEHTLRDPAKSKPASTVEAGVDCLTGVFDRVCFEARLGEEFERARRFGKDFVLVFFDVDEFKPLNDAHGRRAGEDALVLVAQTLRSNARRVDVVARYGSDEFAVLMPGTSLVGARNFFERIRAEVTERSMQTLGFAVRLSAGAVKLHHDAAGDPQDLLESADHAMYVAKCQGKDRLFTAVAVGHGGEDAREAHPTVQSAPPGDGRAAKFSSPSLRSKRPLSL